MGAWGSQPFENDEAADWGNAMAAHSATQDELFEFLDAVLLKAEDIPESEYMELDDGQELVAAIAVVSWLTGMPMDDASVDAALKAQIQASQAADFRNLAPKALRAINRARDSESSELSQLWEESDDFAEWAERLSRFEAHLSAVAQHVSGAQK